MICRHERTCLSDYCHGENADSLLPFLDIFGFKTILEAGRFFAITRNKYFVMYGKKPANIDCEFRNRAIDVKYGRKTNPPERPLRPVPMLGFYMKQLMKNS